MNRSVTLTARGIDVTASDREQAERYLREDALEFRREWDYGVSDVSETDDEAHDGSDEAVIDVDVADSPGRGERIWNGSASFEVVAPGSTDEEAVANALRIIRA
jgi:hypothetical protein